MPKKAKKKRCPECKGKVKMMAYRPYCTGPCYESAQRKRIAFVGPNSGNIYVVHPL